MKHLWKLLIVIMVFALMGSSQAVQLGNSTYGYVEKDYYGDLNSNETIAVIIGVHRSFLRPTFSPSAKEHSYS